MGDRHRLSGIWMTGGQRVSRSLPREEFLHEASGTCFAVFVHVPHSHCFVPTSLRSHSIFAPEWPEKKGNSHQCQMPRKAGFRSITISPRLSMSAFPPHRKPKFGVGLRYPLHSTAAEHLACSAEINNVGQSAHMDRIHNGECRLKLVALHVHFSPKRAMPDLMGQDTRLHHPVAASTSSVAIL